MDISESGVVILEERALIGDILVHALKEAIPNLATHAARDFDAVHQLNPKVLIVSLMSRTMDIAQFERMVGDACVQAKSIPLIFLTDTADDAMTDIIVRHRPRGWIVASLGFPIMVAAVQLVLMGGTFLHTVNPSKLAKAPSAAPAAAPRLERRPSSPLLIDLTQRERDVLTQLKLGKPNKVIAHELNISQSTIKVHLRNMMRKLNVYNRTQVVLASYGEEEVRDADALEPEI
ncbi:helix-turn-helix transcriptional regulator [Methylovirgula sp. 4M-Z18]|uniref:helix-turn-helix transcriptional regulator n=1 Tax=Methylovirgula sp. 4M-Z18 TaxID=2293567 RepID=UPI0013140BBB|nr:response regulator transcription factor [Methylovirgula sp. 4M-Z18]